MSDNVKVLLVGVGYMGLEYYKVLQAMNCEVLAVGRGKESAEKFQQETGCRVLVGGVEAIEPKDVNEVDYAIIATPLDFLKDTCISVLHLGIKNILLEKPAGLNYKEIKEISETSSEQKAKVYVAYNRRFYASTEKAIEIIRADGGLRDMHFEFTEWGDRVRPSVANKSEEIREAWFLANSTHVVDLAWFFGGEPEEMCSYVKKDENLEWHKCGCIYSGAGITKNGVLFSYQADWNAPGRWALELMTHKHRLYLKPMEKLQVQELNSVAVEECEIDDALDREYKPGLYKQTESFLKKLDDGKKITIQEHLKHTEIYAQMEKMS